MSNYVRMGIVGAGSIALRGHFPHLTLDDVRDRGLQVVPVCQFIAGYIRRHPQYMDLLSPESRRAFKV